MFLYEAEKIAFDKNSEFNFDDIKYLKCFSEPSRIANMHGIVNCLKLLNERLKAGDKKFFDIYFQDYKILINEEMKFNRTLLTNVGSIKSEELFKEEKVSDYMEEMCSIYEAMPEIIEELSKPKKTKKVSNVKE